MHFFCFSQALKISLSLCRGRMSNRMLWWRSWSRVRLLDCFMVHDVLTLVSFSSVRHANWLWTETPRDAWCSSCHSGRASALQCATGRGVFFLLVPATITDCLGEFSIWMTSRKLCLKRFACCLRRLENYVKRSELCNSTSLYFSDWWPDTY